MRIISSITLNKLRGNLETLTNVFWHDLGTRGWVIIWLFTNFVLVLGKFAKVFSEFLLPQPYSFIGYIILITILVGLSYYLWYTKLLDQTKGDVFICENCKCRRLLKEKRISDLEIVAADSEGKGLTLNDASLCNKCFIRNNSNSIQFIMRR